MKFPGACLVCGEKMSVGEPGLWQKGVGVKHERCARVKELRCMVCGGPAGCQACEFRDGCDLEAVSQNCICTKCDDEGDAFASYLESAARRFPLLNPK